MSWLRRVVAGLTWRRPDFSLVLGMWNLRLESGCCASFCGVVTFSFLSYFPPILLFHSLNHSVIHSLIFHSFTKLYIHPFLPSLRLHVNNTAVCYIFLNLCTITNEIARLHRNICLAYKSCRANINTCCRLYEVFETVPEKLSAGLTLKFVEI